MESVPTGPEPERGPAGPGPAPSSVATAVRLIWISIGLNVLGAILSFVVLDDLVDQGMENAGEDVTRDVLRVSIIGGLLVGVAIGAGLSALFAIFIGRGAGWARITWTVIAVLGLVLSLPAIGNQPPLTLVLQLVGLVLTVTTLVLLYRPESNAFFARPRPTA